MLGLYFIKSDFRYYKYRCDSSDNYFITNVDWDDEKGDNFLIIVAKELDIAKRGMILESSGCGDNDLGELYEYPSCCIHAYNDILKGNDWKKQIVERTPRSENSYLSNKLAILFQGSSSFLPDYFPCSLSCKEAQRLGKKYERAAYELGHIELYNRLYLKSNLPILVTEDYSFIQLSNKCLDNGIINQEDIIEINSSNVSTSLKSLINGLYIEKIDNFNWAITEDNLKIGKLFTFH